MKNKNASESPFTDLQSSEKSLENGFSYLTTSHNDNVNRFQSHICHKSEKVFVKKFTRAGFYFNLLYTIVNKAK